MKSEVLIEEGIVTFVGDKFAEVSLSSGADCQECSAKIICKPKTKEENILRVNDPFGAKIGDVVRIEIKGSDVLKASFFLYGISLFVLLLGIIIGKYIFAGNKNVDLFSFVIGVCFLSAYFLIFFLIKRKNSQENLPQIISIKRTTE